MSRQRAAVQVNQFINGINTESNPLSFPENASVDELNMEFTTKGSRKRRSGFDVEDGYLIKDTGITYSTTTKLGRSQFRWENPSGDSSKQFLVIQIGNYLAIHNVDSVPLSTDPIYSVTFNASTYSTDFTYSNVDGYLVVATGLKTPSVFSYDGTTITKQDVTLKTRDFWGISVITTASFDLFSASQMTRRPTPASVTVDHHVYNLRNQTFSTPKVEGDADTVNLIDPIEEFYAASSDTVLPSNADSLIQFLVADPNKTTNRTVERFNAQSMWKTPPSNTLAPSGFFVIDLLDRGASRLSEIQTLNARHGALGYDVTSLPTDSTPGGPTITSSYAGRAWYAGFSGLVSGGDSRSPHLDTYIFFSKQVQTKEDISSCFQEGDPTSVLSPDILDTDGGFIKIEGAEKIKALVPLDNSLFVLAKNGVWRVSGKDDNSFSATEYSVSKLTTDGCISEQSVVVIPQGVMYWGEDGIYIISQNETGLWVVQNLTRTTIQTLFNSINSDDKRSVVGYYDPNDPSVRWMYGNGLQLRQGIEELVFNLKFQAFTKNDLGTVSDVMGPLMVDGGVNRVTPSFVKIVPKNSFYCIIVGTDPTLTYTFGGYKEDEILDWETFGGVDSPAYIIAGYANKGSARLRKDVPYLSVFFEQTAADSSCFMEALWDWTDTSSSNRWTTPRQIYRIARLDTGYTMVVTKSKIRGSGKFIAFRFSSDTGKDMHIYGWEFNLEAVTDE